MLKRGPNSQRTVSFNFFFQNLIIYLFKLAGTCAFVFAISFSFADQVHAKIDRSIGTTEIEVYGGTTTEVSVISFEFMQELFNQLANHPRIPFGYPDDGCYARAHKMAILLEQKGVISVKSFLIGDLRIETPHHPSGFVEWWYHVAPSVFVKTGRDDKVFMVFDPAIFDGPVTYDMWTKKQTSHSSGNIDRAYETVRFVYALDSDAKSQDLQDYLINDMVDMETTLDLFKEIQDAREQGVSDEDYLM